VGLDRDLEAAGPAIPVTVETDVLENKSRKMLKRVQDGLNLQLHSWSSGFTFNRFRKRLDKPKTSFVLPTARAILPRGSGDRALQECNPSTEPPMDCSDCIPPGSGKLSNRVLALEDASAGHGQSEKLIVSSAVRPPSSHAFTHKLCHRPIIMR
jgi:hypothetical protein